MLSKLISSAAATGALLAVAGAANAGGFVAPVAETPIVAPIVDVAPASDWAGGYAGVSLGYSFNGDDEVGLDFYDGGVLDGRETGLTNLDLHGVTADLHAGYRWQRGSWVFGPELAIEGGSVDDTQDFDNGVVAGTVESSVNYVATLAMKTGYVVNPATMVYGSAGFAYGDFSYAVGSSPDEDYNASGYTLGLGVERKVSDRMSVFAEYQYRDFGSEDVTFTDGTDSIVTVATPKHQNIKVGVNFRF